MDNKPPVVRLEVHTEGQHQVYFREGGEEAAALREDGTKLLAWFEANKHFPGAKHLRYWEFPRYFVWKIGPRAFHPRAKLRVRGTPGPSSGAAPVEYSFSGEGEKVIGRLYNVSPREGERYYL